MPEEDLREAIKHTLETIVDPCSLAAGAPAGLVSMGLVGPVSVKPAVGGLNAEIEVTLFVTEPGCMMSALFQVTAEQKLQNIKGVSTAKVHVDHSHIWEPTQMTQEYRQRLSQHRSCQGRHMTLLNAANRLNGRIET